MENNFLSVENVTKKYGNVEALKGVTLSFEPSGQYAIRGSSGSGKSTLLYLLGGLDRPSSGKIWLQDRELEKLSDKQLAQFRNKFVGFVFQFHFLLPSMNCMKNILLPSKIGQCDTAEITKHVEELAERLGVGHCLKKFPYELSGGEQQRINIVRALSLKPKLLLCDEPTGNLDSENSKKVTTLLKEISDEFGATLVVVTHDASVASQFSHQVMFQDGKVLH